MMPDDKPAPTTFRELLGLDEEARLPLSKVKAAAERDDDWGAYAKTILKLRGKRQDA